MHILNFPYCSSLLGIVIDLPTTNVAQRADPLLPWHQSRELLEQNCPFPFVPDTDFVPKTGRLLLEIDHLDTIFVCFPKTTLPTSIDFPEHFVDFDPIQKDLDLGWFLHLPSSSLSPPLLAADSQVVTILSVRGER
jgi:hypothetical protein